MDYGYHKPPPPGWITDHYNGMAYRQLGNSGLWVSNLGLGTARYGYPESGDGASIDEKTAFRIFDRSIELGVVFWDTANCYSKQSGNAERVIGKWLHKNPDQRRNIVLATKIFAQMDGSTPNHSRLSRTNIMDSVYACLDRLQVDHIDLLYFHYYDPITPAEESLAAIEDLVSKDLVRYFGVSNFSVEQLLRYKAAEKTFSLRCKMVAVQNQFDILNGESPWRLNVLEQVAGWGMSFIAWSPLARGLLSRRYRELMNVGPGDWRYDGNYLEDMVKETTERKLAKLSTLAHQWGMDLNQLAIAYMLSMPGMGPIIASVSDSKQLESNAAAASIELTREQFVQLNEVLQNH